MKLTEKQTALITYLQKNGRVSADELYSAFDTDARHFTAVITGLACGSRGKGLVDYEKVAVEGQEKPVKYVFLTDAGKAWAPSAEDDED